MMIYHTTLLLSVAWVLLIFNEKQVYCGTVVVSSSSSDCGTFCNGMCCPTGSNCVVSSNVINGNRTSDTRCSNINGEVLRQEIITVSNGEECIKNYTRMGEKLNVEQSCRNLNSPSSSDCGTFCSGICCPTGSSCAVSVYGTNGNKTSNTRCSNIYGEVLRQEIITVSNGQVCIKNFTMGENANVEQSCRNLSQAEIDYMQQQQAAIENAMKERSKLFEEQMNGVQAGIKKTMEAVNMQTQRIQQAVKAGTDQLNARLAEMNRKLANMFG